MEIEMLKPVVLARYLEIEDITFSNLSVYHHNLHDKKNCIIAGYRTKGEK